MNRITQEIRWRLSMVNYATKHGASEASRKYRVSRQTVYRWVNRYNGTNESLVSKSRRPHSHPNQHTDSEIKLITDYVEHHRMYGLVVQWIELVQRGYQRSISSLYRMLKRPGFYSRGKPPVKAYTPKPYRQMTFPGERVQVDVKQVPAACLVNGLACEKFYQYTAIDEFSRLRYTEIFRGKDTYASTVFLIHMLKYFPFDVKSVRTDNGREFTNRLSGKKFKPSLFEKALHKRKIVFSPIRPYTPRHNGKVERSHRSDNERFYSKNTFSFFQDLKDRAASYLVKSNNFPMAPLKWLSPVQFLDAYLSSLNVTFV